MTPPLKKLVDDDLPVLKTNKAKAAEIAMHILQLQAWATSNHLHHLLFPPDGSDPSGAAAEGGDPNDDDGISERDALRYVMKSIQSPAIRADLTAFLKRTAPTAAHAIKRLNTNWLGGRTLGAVLKSELQRLDFRHVARRLEYLQDRVRDGDARLMHIRTEGNIADIGTKALNARTFHHLTSFVWTST